MFVLVAASAAASAAIAAAGGLVGPRDFGVAESSSFPPLPCVAGADGGVAAGPASSKPGLCADRVMPPTRTTPAAARAESAPATVVAAVAAPPLPSRRFLGNRAAIRNRSGLLLLVGAGMFDSPVGGIYIRCFPSSLSFSSFLYLLYVVGRA